MKPGQPPPAQTIRENTEAFFSLPQVKTGLLALKSLAEKPFPKDLHFIRYEDLCFIPLATLGLLYDFLEYPRFDHDPQRVSPLPAERLFFGITPLRAVSGPLRLSQHEPEALLGQDLDQEILKHFRWYFTRFYPEVLVQDPRRLVKTDELAHLRAKKDQISKPV